jgi:hypothetical protein
MLSFKGVINCGLAEDGGWVLADRQPIWKEQDIQRRKRNLARDRERDIKVTEKKKKQPRLEKKLDPDCRGFGCAQVMGPL